MTRRHRFVAFALPTLISQGCFSRDGMFPRTSLAFQPEVTTAKPPCVQRTTRHEQRSLLSLRSTRGEGEGDAATDWVEAELTLRSFPPGPSPDLPPDRVSVSVCRALQFVDHPTENSGLRRIFPFLTWECRKTVTARRGGDTVDAFVRHGLLSPALQPFMGASRIELGEGTLTPRTATRGSLVSFPVTVSGAAVLAFQHKSGMIRDRVGEKPPETHMVIRLEEERRPPMQGCWLVREILDVRYAFAGDMGNVHVGG